MKATGIVRRIDDLGRVVIPKELRRTMHLREGAPLEIFTEKDGELTFKKYSPIGEPGEFAADMCDSLRKAARWRDKLPPCKIREQMVLFYRETGTRNLRDRLPI